MHFIRSPRPRVDGTFVRLTEFAARYSLPLEGLLEQAVTGKIKIFVRIPTGLDAYSVHQHGIVSSDPTICVDKVVSRVGRPDPIESMPVNMVNQGLIGLLLSRLQCNKLRDERFVSLSLFDHGLAVRLTHVDEVDPIQRNLLHKDKKLRPEGWKIACYHSGSPPTFVDGVGYTAPEILEIEWDDLFATAASVELFLNDIDTNHFIDDLIVDGHVVHIDERPAYFSPRLNQLLDTHWWYRRAIDADEIAQLVWPGRSIKSRSEREKRDRAIEKVRKQHELAKSLLTTDEFSRHLQKTQKAHSLIEAAAKFATPQHARGVLVEFTRSLPVFDLQTVMTDPFPLNPELTHPEVPADIKGLVAGAKLFWGHPSFNFSDANTHPARSDVVDFMKEVGFSSADAESAATIISHDVPRGRPKAVNNQKKEILRHGWDPLHKLRKK